MSLKPIGWLLDCDYNVFVIWLNSHFCWLQTNLTRKTFSHVVLHSWMLNYWPKLIFASRMNFALIVSIDCASICWAQFKLNVFECGWTMKRGKSADLQSRSPKLIWMTVQHDHSPERRCSNVQMFTPSLSWLSLSVLSSLEPCAIFHIMFKCSNF